MVGVWFWHFALRSCLLYGTWACTIVKSGVWSIRERWEGDLFSVGINSMKYGLLIPIKPLIIKKIPLTVEGAQLLLTKLKHIFTCKGAKGMMRV